MPHDPGKLVNENPEPTSSAPVSDPAEEEEKSPADLSDTELFEKLAQRILKRRKIEQELELAKKSCSELEEVALERMTAAGIQNVQVKGLTLYIHQQLWATAAANRDEACDALIEAGLDHYVNRQFSTQSLSALFRERAQQQEWEDVEELLEEELRGKIKLTEVYKLRSRKAAAK